jgi:class 3 adenylate cyclase
LLRVAADVCEGQDDDREAAYRQVRDRIKEGFVDLGEQELKNIARPVRAYALKVSSAGSTPASALEKPSAPPSRRDR